MWRDGVHRPQAPRWLSGFSYFQKKGTCWSTFPPRTKVVKWLSECRSSRSGKKCSESLTMVIIRMRERADTDVPGEEHLEAGINKSD